MRFLLLLLLLSPAGALARVDMDVETSKKTTRTNISQSTYSRSASYVDRVTLSVTLAANPETSAELACYFVGRDVRTHALSYYGFEKQPVRISRAGRVVEVQSQPIPYTEYKRSSSSSESRTGRQPFGWVVIATSGKSELAVKASSRAVLKWVRANAPQKSIKLAP